MLGFISLWLSLSLAALVGAVPPRTAQPTIFFRGVFAGVADGEHCLWEGPVEGAARGRLSIKLRQVEEPAAAAHPVWHVAGRWTVRDDRDGHSFTADLEGMVDWKGRSIRLAGFVTQGWLRGSWVETSGRVINGDLSGVLSITPPQLLGSR